MIRSEGDWEADALHRRLEEIREEIQEFADTFPGDSYQWQSVQDFAKRIVAKATVQRVMK